MARLALTVALALNVALGLAAPTTALAQGAPSPPPDQSTPAATVVPATPSAPPSAAAAPASSATPATSGARPSSAGATGTTGSTSPPAQAKPTEVAPPATPTRPAPNPTGSIGRVPNTAQLSIAAMSRGKGPPLAWDPAWPTFRPIEYYVAGAGLGASIASQIARPRAKHWKGGVLFDEGFRKVARPGAYYARQTAEDASDVLLSLVISYPFAVDALGVAWWHRGSDQVAAQMALINAEALTITMGLQSVATVIGSRERPYGRTCGGELDAQSVDCTSSNRHRSYFSGHTSVAFVGASLTCTHHAYLQLYGGGTPDTVVCVSGLALAGLTGFFRIMGDRHYATDVLSGAVIGSATGFLVPWLLHYRGGAGRAARAAEGPKHSGLSLYPIASPGLFGVGGSFL